MKTMVLVVGFAAILASCGAEGGDAGVDEPVVTVTSSTTAPEMLAEPVPLLVVAEVGGCYMMGPNCTTTLVMSDGSFGVYRNDPVDVMAVPESLDEAEYRGAVDVADLARTVAATDFTTLRASLGPGECMACVDGIDYRVRVFTGAGPEDLASVDYEFDEAIAFFAELAEVRRAAAAAGTLELVPRS